MSMDEKITNENTRTSALEAMKDSIILTLKAALGINGASGLAYFAFLGGIIAKGEYEGCAWITSVPLIGFAVGVLCAVWAIYATVKVSNYDARIALVEQARQLGHEVDDDYEKKSSYWGKHMVLGLFASLVCFVFGIGATAILIAHVV